MLGILCGLEQEASLARRVDGVIVACAAARPQKARWLARELIGKGAKRLISFGVAGGLEPGLPIGTLVIGTHVASRDGLWTCDKEWVNELSHKIPAAHCGGVWGSEILIPTATDKRSLYEKSRCLIVDMESQCAGQIASEANIPFAVLRAVCDASDMEMPSAVLAAIKDDGSTDYGRVLFHLLRHPQQIPGLFHVSGGIRKALKALEGVAKVV